MITGAFGPSDGAFEWGSEVLPEYIKESRFQDWWNDAVRKSWQENIDDHDPKFLVQKDADSRGLALTDKETYDNVRQHIDLAKEHYPFAGQEFWDAFGVAASDKEPLPKSAAGLRYHVLKIAISLLPASLVSLVLYGVGSWIGFSGHPLWTTCAVFVAGLTGIYYLAGLKEDDKKAVIYDPETVIAVKRLMQIRDRSIAINVFRDWIIKTPGNERWYVLSKEDFKEWEDNKSPEALSLVVTP